MTRRDVDATEKSLEMMRQELEISLRPWVGRIIELDKIKRTRKTEDPLYI
jgi:hypothetical protein